MARMIPADGPVANASRVAEPMLYQALAAHLDDSFTVIHSVPWLSQAVDEFNPQHRPTGEIDFLILHPQYGMLAIEVKGGYYRFDRNALVLLSTGTRIDPVAQVRRSVHALARWLYAVGAPARKIGYAVALPQADLRGQPLPPAYIDWSAGHGVSITIDRNDLPHLGDRISDLLRYWQTALQTSPLTRRQIDAIVDAICPVADYRPRWADRIAEDHARWLVLTNEQAQCLHHIATQSRTVLTGRSGTGKTLLALARARDLAQAGHTVLFLAYNARLVQHLQQELVDTNVTVMTFHSLCRLAQRTRQIVAIEDDAWYREGGPASLQDAIAAGVLPAYTALVIDEAQVFAPEWIAMLARWFNGQTILASSDETQVFRFERSTSAPMIADLIGAGEPYILTINLRSPRAVFERVQRALPTAFQQSSPRELMSDTLVEHIHGDPQQQLRTTIRRLHARGVPPDAITVIYIDTEPEIDPMVRAMVREVTPIHKYRGLESPIIIVFAVGRWDTLDEQVLACAYTRATTRCIAIYHPFNALSNRESIWYSLLLATQPQARAYLDDLWPPLTMRNGTTVIQEPARIDWLAQWGGWVLVREWTSDPVVQKLWISQLLATTTDPVYDMQLTYPGHMLMLTAQADYAHAWSGTLYHWDWCTTCQQWRRTLRHGHDRICLDCTQPPQQVQPLPQRIATDLQRYRAILAQPHQYTLDEKRRVPIAIVALGRWLNITPGEQDALRHNLHSGSCPGFFISKVLTGIDVVRTPIGATIRLDDMQTRYQTRYPALASDVDDVAWRRWISMSLAAWIKLGLMRKLSPGIYQRIAAPEGSHPLAGEVAME